MNHGIARLAIAVILSAGAARLLSAQRPGTAQYPNVDKAVTIAPGETVQLLIRFMNDGGPAMRTPGKRLDLVYSTTIPASDAPGRRAQADRAAQLFGLEAAELGVRHLSIGICDSRACAERKHPPSEWYLYERGPQGWKRAP
jgi:hypothetical protein